MHLLIFFAFVAFIDHFVVLFIVAVAFLLSIFAYADKLAKPAERQLRHPGLGGL